MGTEFLVGAMENRVLTDDPVIKLFLSSSQLVPVDVNLTRTSRRWTKTTRLTIEPDGASVHDYGYEHHMTADDDSFKCKFLYCMWGNKR